MNPTDAQYNTALQQIIPNGESALPFTGFDVIALVVVALATLATGAYLRWRVGSVPTHVSARD
jgi:hypothetical protein